MKRYSKSSGASTPAAQPTWSDLLREAVEKPGRLLEAYSYFYNYSVGNQLLALSQCYHRNIQPGPISTYQGWLNLKRQVKRGERAIWLCMPITRKGTREKEEAQEASAEEGYTFISFIYKPNWFVMAQTEGEELPPPSIPEWDKERALDRLMIREVPFESTDGNSQGYAQRRSFAISPIAALPHKTTFHELGHIMLGHTEEASFADGEHTPRNLREVEAEAVALICCESLQLDGAEYARGYIQHWLGNSEIPEKSAQKIFRAADSILKAGRPEEAKEVA
jgi:antirestriction protein ArdC